MSDMPDGTHTITNRTLDEIKVGDSATLSRVLSRDDILLFASVSGDVNPAHVDEEFAKSDFFQKIIAHGMWGAALISTVLGTELPGPGTIYLGQTLRFKRPVSVGDKIATTVTVLDKNEETAHVRFQCVCRNERGDEVISGEAEVLAPRKKISRPRKTLPEVKLLERFVRFGELIRLAEPLPPMKAAIVHPVDKGSLQNCLEAYKDNLIQPILVGPEFKIRAVARFEDIDIEKFKIVPVEHSHAAAELAAKMAAKGEVQLIMKGTLSTEELLSTIRATRTLRTGRMPTHVHALDVPTFPRTLYMTDTEFNIEQDLSTKTSIVQNAVDLLHALGNRNPKVAILSASEWIDLRMQSTLDAAALCKMAERDQIKGALVDGPMPFDIAVSTERSKPANFVSSVAGEAEILIVPDMEAGRILVQQLKLLMSASAAGITLGYKVPIITPAPNDDVRTCEAACALAAMWANFHENEDARKKMPQVRERPLA